MAKFLGHIPCTYVDCGSSDAMALYLQEEGQTTGFCFSCKRYDSNPNKELLVEDTSIPKDNNEYFLSIAEFPSVGHADRGIDQYVMHLFGVKAAVSTADGTTPTAFYYPYTREGQVIAYKLRILPKDFSIVGEWKLPELFGQTLAKSSGAKKLFITEGELDALSLFQCLKNYSKGTQWASLNPAVVSVCNGAGSAVKDLSRNIQFVKGFDEVILVFDQDEVGQKAQEDILKLIPEAKVVQLPLKDANEMLLANRGVELAKAALFGGTKYKPASIVSVADVYERAISKPKMGMSWPFSSLTKETYGINRKTLYGFGAGVGMGKSDLAKELQQHLLTTHKVPVGLFNFEEDVGRTLKGIAGKIHDKMYHKPDAEWPEGELEGAIKELQDKVFMFDHFGTKDWQDIKSAIRYLVASEGVKDIFIDPLTALVAHLTSAEANDALNTIMSEISGMVHELDFTVYYFCHLNPPQSGPPHERGGKVHELQFTGSRSMMKWSNYLLGLEGNKDPELPKEERNTRHVVLLKDREYGRTCRFPLFYNDITGRLKEPKVGMY